LRYSAVLAHFSAWFVTTLVQKSGSGEGGLSLQIRDMSAQAG